MFSAMLWIRSRLRKVGVGFLDQVVFVTVTQLVRQIGSTARGRAAGFFLNSSFASVTVSNRLFWHQALEMTVFSTVLSSGPKIVRPGGTWDYRAAVTAFTWV